MNRTPFLILGFSLLVIAAVVGLARWKGAGNDTADESADPKHLAERRTGRSAPAKRKIANSSEADAYLRLLSDPASGERTTFAEMEAVAAKLNAEDLDEWIRDLADGGFAGVHGWVACALFAEWGRRDAKAAVEFLAQLPESDERHFEAGQAWHAMFRGWAERDAMLAYETLMGMEGAWELLGGPAYQRATAAIFRELARQDTAGAWRLLQEREGGLEDRDAVAGFFAGLRDGGMVRQFLDEWTATQWDSEAAREAYAAYLRQLNSGGPNLLTPPEEEIATRIAGAWAAYNLDAALAWLGENGPGDRQHRLWRASQTARNWARANPEQALGKLGDERYSDHQVLLGHGIIMGDPSLATQVVERFDGYAMRAAIMTAVVSVGDFHDGASRFPTPREAGMPPDHEARYHHLLDAVEAGEFPERKARELRERIAEQYRDLVPAAREAVEARQRH